MKDPQFGKDISFFAFDLPFYRFVLGFAFATVVVSLIAAAVTHYLYGGLAAAAVRGERATPAARVHLSVLLGVFVLLKAVAYWLDRYGLAVKERPHRTSRLHRPDLHRRQRGAAGPNDPGDHRADLRRAVLRQHRPAHLAAARRRRRPAAALRDAHRRHLPGDRAAVPGPAVASRRRRRRTSSATSTRRATAYGIDKVEVQDLLRRRTAGHGQPAARPTRTRRRASGCSTRRIVCPTFKNLQQIRAYYDFADTPRRRPLRHQRRGARRRGGRPRARPDGPAGRAEQLDQRPHRLHPRLRLRRGARQHERRAAARRSCPRTSRRPGSSTVEQPRIYFGEESPSYSIVGGPEGCAAAGARLPDRHRRGWQTEQHLRRRRRRRRRVASGASCSSR